MICTSLTPSSSLSQSITTSTAEKSEMSGAAVALLNALDTLSSSSPSKADENEFAKLKKKFTELSSNNMEAVILHVDLAIAEELVSEIPNYQIDQV